MAEHDLDFNDVITAHGMVLGRSFTASDFVVLDDLAELMPTESSRDHFCKWLSHIVWNKMEPGEQAPVELRELLAAWSATQPP